MPPVSAPVLLALASPLARDTMVENSTGSEKQDWGRMQPGDRMFIPCEGGPSTSRLERYPPPLEIEERGGLYVLEDDGPPEQWRYLFVPNAL